MSMILAVTKDGVRYLTIGLTVRELAKMLDLDDPEAMDALTRLLKEFRRDSAEPRPLAFDSERVQEFLRQGVDGVLLVPGEDDEHLTALFAPLLPPRTEDSARG